MGCASSRARDATSGDFLTLGVPGYADSPCDADHRRETLQGGAAAFVAVDINAADSDEVEDRVYTCGRGRRGFSGEPTMRVAVRDADSCRRECLSRTDCRGARYTEGREATCDLWMSSVNVVCAPTRLGERYFLKKEAPGRTFLGDAGTSAFLPSVGMVPPDASYAAPYVPAGAPMAIKYTPWKLGLVLLTASMVCAVYVFRGMMTKQWSRPFAGIAFALSVTASMVVLLNL